MGNISHTVGGDSNLVSFRSAARVPITSLKAEFLPVQEGEGDPSPDNIRPIKGWDSIVLNQSGKNFIPQTLQWFRTYPNQGQYKSANAYSTFIVPIPKGQIICRSNVLGGFTYCSLSDELPNSGATVIAQITMSSRKSYTFDNSKGHKYLVCTVGRSLENTTDFIKTRELMITLVNNEYSSPMNNTIELNWSSTLGTVYGGYIDIAKGELVQTHAYKILNEVDNWITYTSTAFAYDNEVFPIDYSKGTSHGITCTSFQRYAENKNLGCRWLNNNNNVFFVIRFSSDTTITLDDIKQLASENKIALTYELATPITYQLSPTQLQTLLDQNNIWTNTNSNTEVSYAIHDSAMIRSTKKQIIGNEPHIETASGNIASFQTDMVAPLKEAKIYFNPVQAGSGDPSPSNIREIYGWDNIYLKNYNDSINLYQQPTQELDVFGLHIACSNNHETIYGTATVTRRLNTAGYNAVNGLYISGTTKLYNGAKWSIYNGNALIEEVDDINGKLYYSDSDKLLRLGITLIEGVFYDLDFYIIYTETPPINLSWASTAGTLYGGYVDLIKGELVQTYNKITLDGVTTNCRVNSDYSNDTYIIGGVVYLTPTGARDYYSGYRSKLFCNNTPLIGAGDQELNTLPFIRTIGNGAQYLRIYAAYTADHSELDTAQKRKDYVNNYLEEHPIEIIYPLVTPIVHQLTPTQLKALRGQNNIWSNSNGPIEIKYWTH